jgi:hypothetical protein
MARYTRCMKLSIAICFSSFAQAAGSRRYIKVAKSPAAPLVSVAYVITRRGVESVDHNTGPASDHHQGSEGATGSVVGMRIRNNMSGMGWESR